MGFSAPSDCQLKRASYAKHTHVKKIRSLMINYIQETISKCTIKEVMEHLITDNMPSDIKILCSSIRPVKDFSISNVKLIRSPKSDVGKSMEIHLVDRSEEDVLKESPILTSAIEVDRNHFEPPIQASV